MTLSPAKSGVLSILLAAGLFVGGISAHAATSTWSGSAGSTDWNTAADWGGTAVASGNALVFTSANASSTATLTDTLANGFSIGSITFNSGAIAYTMTGNSIALSGGVTNNSTSLETINNAIALSGTSTMTLTTGGGNTTLGGIVSGSGGAITLAGTGTLTLGAADTYTGTTTIAAGTVLSLTTGANLASSAVTFSANGTLLTTANTGTVAGVNINSGVLATLYSSSGTLALQTISRSAGGLLDVSALSGILSATNANTAGILGPWAFAGTTPSLYYVIGGTKLALLGSGSNGFTGTQTLSGLTSTGNYEYTAPATLASGQTANTLSWWHGTAAGTLTNAGLLTVNGIMNTGSGLLTISSGSITSGGSELDIISNAFGVSISAPITGSIALVYGGPLGGTGTLTLSGTNTYSGNTYIDTGALAIGGAGQLGSGTYAGNILNSGTFLYSSSATQTLSGNISGTGALTDSALSGTLTLSGSNSFTGIASISSVVQLIANAGNGQGTTTDAALTSGAGGVTFGNGGVIQLRANSNTTFLGTVTGGTGNATLGFDVNDNNSGGTTGDTLSFAGFKITNTTINVTGGNGYILGLGGLVNSSANGVNTIVPTTANIVLAGYTSSANSPSTLVLAGTSTGNTIGAINQGSAATNTLTKAGSSTWTITGAGTFAGGTTISAGTLIAGVSNVSTTSGAFGPSADGVTLGDANTTANNSSPTLLIGGAFTVSNPITVASQATSGTYTIGGSNTTGTANYTGNITLNEAVTLQAATGGTVDFNTGTWATGNNVITVGTSGNAGTVEIDRAVATSGGVNVNAGTFVLGNSLTVTGGTLAVATTGTLTSNSSGTVTGNATLTGNGAINLNSASGISGTLGVTGGNWNGAGSVGGLVTSSSGTFTIGSGANLTANSGLSVTGGIISGTGTITGSVGYTSSSNDSFAGVIAGSGSLTMNNSASTLTLSGSNTYSGGTTITAGTVVVTGNNSTLGSTTGSLTLGSAGTLGIDGTAGNSASNFNIGNVTVGALNGSGTITNVDVSADGYNSSLIVGNGGASGSFSGAITDGSDQISLIKMGTGTQVLSGNSQYSGGTTITGGVVSITSEANIGDAGGYFSGGTSGLILGGGQLLTTSTGTLIEGVQLNAASTNTLAAAAGTVATYTGTITDTSSTGSLTVGSGTSTGAVALSRNNTYSGGTSVAAGTLILNNGTNGSATGTGSLVVHGGATLAGIGTSASGAGSNFAIAGTGTTSSTVATVLVGHNSAADINTAGVTYLTAPVASTIANANLVFNLNTALPGSSTELNVGSTNITFNSGGVINTTLTLNMENATFVPAYSAYALIIGNGTTITGLTGTPTTTSGQFAGLSTFVNSLGQNQIVTTGSTGLLMTFGDSISNAEYGPGSYLFINNSGGVDEIEVEVVPEPSTYALMLGGLMLLVAIQRRKRS